MHLRRFIGIACIVAAFFPASGFAQNQNFSTWRGVKVAHNTWYVRNTPECQNLNNLPQSCCTYGVETNYVGCGVHADGSRRTSNVGVGCCQAGGR